MLIEIKNDWVLANTTKISHLVFQTNDFFIHFFFFSHCLQHVCVWWQFSHKAKEWRANFIACAAFHFFNISIFALIFRKRIRGWERRRKIACLKHFPSVINPTIAVQWLWMMMNMHVICKPYGVHSHTHLGNCDMTRQHRKEEKQVEGTHTSDFFEMIKIRWNEFAILRQRLWHDFSQEKATNSYRRRVDVAFSLSPPPIKCGTLKKPIWVEWGWIGEIVCNVS